MTPWSHRPQNREKKVLTPTEAYKIGCPVSGKRLGYKNWNYGGDVVFSQKGLP